MLYKNIVLYKNSIKLIIIIIKNKVLFEGVRTARENVIRRPYGTKTSGIYSESQWLYKEGMLMQCWGALG